MFTANSMNCLTEAIGLSLPGNGSTLATHAKRRALFEEAGRVVVDLCRRYYEQDDESVLPRNIANRSAFENAVALDVAMGGSTNTVLHLLAAAREAELDFDVHDIDAISRRVPCLSKVAPNSPEVTTWRTSTAPAASRPSSASCAAAGRSTRTSTRSTRPASTSGSGSGTSAARARRPRHSSCSRPLPAASVRRSAFSTENRWGTLDTDAAEGCIRDFEHAYSADGGLAILTGNIAVDGCVVKTAGVPEESL